MTALNQYQRLEAAGIWRESPRSQLRDVIVSFGDATLVLTDPRSEVPLAHWSLPAVTRLNPGKLPARYAPGGLDAGEELEIDDELMISAISKVHQVIEASKPHPGRLRGGLMLSAAAVMALLAVFWVPPALVRHAADIAPRRSGPRSGAWCWPRSPRPPAAPVRARPATWCARSWRCG